MSVNRRDLCSRGLLLSQWRVRAQPPETARAVGLGESFGLVRGA